MLQVKSESQIITSMLSETLDVVREIRAKMAESAPSASTNTGSPKLFLLQVQEAVECDECSDADKIHSIKLLIAEQLRAGA